jgi:hypothetical protein
MRSSPQNPGLCDYLENNRIPYVMAVPKTTRFTDATTKTVQFDALAPRLPPHSWQRRSCGLGSKGFRVYDWALIDSDHPDHQYLIRRSITDGELAFYHCYNPHHARFGELVGVAGARWPIEECFGSGKNEVGLDHYQVRTWDAWHRHITLAMLAHTFLAITAHTTKKRGASTPRNSTKTTTHPVNRPNRKPRHPPTDALSHSPSPKSADYSILFTTANTPSPTACTGQPGAVTTKPKPAEPTSNATSAYKH